MPLLDDARRAAAYADRGDAYAEKARYLRAFDLVSGGASDELFQLGIRDHDQAIALEPGSAKMYYRRGLHLLLHCRPGSEG